MKKIALIITVLTIALCITACGNKSSKSSSKVAEDTTTSSIKDKRAQVLKYLYDISGKKTLAGQHNREPSAEPSMWTDSIKKITGKYPALWSCDFLFQQENIDNRWTMIYEAEREFNKGAVVSLMWHACPPDMDEPCGWDPGVLNNMLTDEQWKDLLTEGTSLNKRWIKRMDEISVYFEYLQEKNVIVLFKPFHEMNQRLFWWAGRPGENGTAKLYRYLHDYFTKTKGLNNIIWVWDMQDIDRTFEAYNPGDKYWDVFAFDIYDKGYDKSWYDYILPIVGNKPMAIGECAKLPTEELLESQPRWIYFMDWAELVVKENDRNSIKTLYNAPRIITLDQMPGWKGKSI